MNCHQLAALICLLFIIVFCNKYIYRWTVLTGTQEIRTVYFSIHNGNKSRYRQYYCSLTVVLGISNFLKSLNQFILCLFVMKMIASVLSSVMEGNWMVSLDLKRRASRFLSMNSPGNVLVLYFWIEGLWFIHYIALALNFLLSLSYLQGFHSHCKLGRANDMVIFDTSTTGNLCKD